MASERASMEACSVFMPCARSWNVAWGCMTVKNALGSNDLELIRMDASARYFSVSSAGAEGKGDSHWTPCPFRERCRCERRRAGILHVQLTLQRIRFPADRLRRRRRSRSGHRRLSPRGHGRLLPIAFSVVRPRIYAARKAGIRWIQRRYLVCLEQRGFVDVVAKPRHSMDVARQPEVITRGCALVIFGGC